MQHTPDTTTLQHSDAQAPAPAEDTHTGAADITFGPPSETAVQPETRAARFRRMARRTRLHLFAAASVVVLVYVVALATSNTRRVSVDWVFAHSNVPLVWLTLFTAILGWLLGILITVLFRARTRAPR